MWHLIPRIKKKLDERGDVYKIRKIYARARNCAIRQPDWNRNVTGFFLWTKIQNSWNSRQLRIKQCAFDFSIQTSYDQKPWERIEKVRWNNMKMRTNKKMAKFIDANENHHQSQAATWIADEPRIIRTITISIIIFLHAKNIWKIKKLSIYCAKRSNR